MRYALMVAETGSVNGAAQRYFLDAPSISRAVKALERDLGTQIFARSPKGMVLTPDGELFVQNARGVLRQVDELFRFRPARELYRGCVRPLRAAAAARRRTGAVL